MLCNLRSFRIKKNVFPMSNIYKKVIRPVFFGLDPELSHEIACGILSKIEKSQISKSIIRYLVPTKEDKVTICGINFPNRIGLAAGFDKNGMFPGVMSALGFGHIEIGTITPLPQPGNEKPRLYRVPEESGLINRMGFNNQGADSILERIDLQYPKHKRSSPLGINIGKGISTPLEKASDDYLISFEKFWQTADYFTINVSSPNTKNLRELQQVHFLEPLLKSIDSKNEKLSKTHKSEKVPCFIKISPDENFSVIEKIVALASEQNISGIIATNTTSTRPSDKKNYESGGWSGGEFIERKSNNVIKFIAKLTEYKMPIIGVGGITDTDTASRKLDLGAQLVQLYTSLVYEGPLFPSQLTCRMVKRSSWFT